MISQVIVSIADEYREKHAPIQLFEVGAYGKRATVVFDSLNDI